MKRFISWNNLPRAKFIHNPSSQTIPVLERMFSGFKRFGSLKIMNIYKGYYKLRPPVNWQIENKFRKFCFSLYVLYLRYMYLYVSFRKKRSHRRYTSLFMTGIPCLHYTNVDFSYAPLQTTTLCYNCLFGKCL